MHLHFEKNSNTKCDCTVLSLSWMGKVPDDIPEDEGWKLNRTNYYQEGWLATGNMRGIVGVTFTTSHCKKNLDSPVRTNYNLRGHRSDVMMIRWNEPYQKLASCDSSGIIFVWIKYEGRWSIELINDRNTPVTYFSWSHDGRMALICYQDGFVLVGSVAGQRYWSSMLNLDATITCGIWTPDDQQVYFGTTHGQIIVMDVHGAMVSQVQLCHVGITSMAWSCEKFKMEEGEDAEPGVTNAAKRSFVLAVSFENGIIYLLKSFDDVLPIQINTEMNGSLGLSMEWSNSRELLAVAGTQQSTVPQYDSQGQLIHDNVLKFYNENGSILYTARIPNTTGPVSALTWGHNDKRIFIATGTIVHIAWVSRKVASLQLLCRLQIQSSLKSEGMLMKLPLPLRLKTLIGNLFAQTVRCYVPDFKSLRDFVSRPPNSSTRLHCTMIRHDVDGTNLSSGTCYTLYLEYIGGLVPLLKGKRTSKIRPEFVIFDPQLDEADDVVQMTKKGGSASSKSTTTSGGTGRSDSSGASEFEWESQSPRAQRKRKTKGKKHHHQHESGGTTAGIVMERPRGFERAEDDLSYADTLPEIVKLVQVTSNIWGTKFKIHGLAKTVPSNLGQVTYKTSLLHLQPRQMTLIITELRDDCAVDRDPNFNPNVFSEDEEEPISQGALSSRVHRCDTGGAPMIAPMSPRPTRFNNHFKQNVPPAAPSSLVTGAFEANIARAESYEDDAPVESNGIEDRKSPIQAACSTARSGPSYASIVTQYSRSSSSSGQSRHAISPLCSEGSVPTLQSPKNAVAPVDIIFDRPPATQGGNLLTYWDTNHLAEAIQSKIKCENPEFKKYNSSSTQDTKGGKRKDLQFIDEESPATSNIKAAVISPIVPMEICVDAIPRSCSVGYLDSVQMVPSDSALSILRREAPHKRLILVNKRPQKKASRDIKTSFQRNVKSKSLEKFDLSKIEKNSNLVSPGSSKPIPKPKAKGPDAESTAYRSNEPFMSKTPLMNRKERPRVCIACKLITPTVNSRELLCTKCRAAQSNIEVDAAEPSSSSAKKDSPKAAPDSPTPKRYDLRSILDRTLAKGSPSRTIKRKTEIIKSYADSPLFNRKHRFQDQEPLTKHERSLSMGRKSASKRHSGTDSENDLHPTDSSPRISGLSSTFDNLIGRGRTKASSSTKEKRSMTSSPIRQILNSPLLGRRYRKCKQQLIESSDDEQTADEDVQHVGLSLNTSPRQYRDLETFQKAQLRHKLKRGKIEPNGRASGASSSSPAPLRREFVMHNKAPMWNENSQVYQLDFGGRVTQESAKNFQIEFRGKQVMQFGRIDGNAYTLDFQYPFSAIQAFGVALANVTQRMK